MIKIQAEPKTKASLISAYNLFMQNKHGQARQVVARFYNEGVENPRATLLTAAREMRIINARRFDFPSDSDRVAKAEYMCAHLSARDEIESPSHPMPKKAKARCQKAFEELYPAPATQLFSRFIIAKNKHPFVKYFKGFLGAFGE